MTAGSHEMENRNGRRKKGNRDPDREPGILGRGRQRSSRQERGWFQISGKRKIKKPVNKSQVIHDNDSQII